MDIELINIDKQEVSLRLYNQNKNDLFNLLDEKEYSDIKIIFKEIKEDLKGGIKENENIRRNTKRRTFI